MSFHNILDASIDFSPSPTAKQICLALHESDLRCADTQRMERFVRVWCTDVEKYAPYLKDITILFRPSTQDGINISVVGINKFLQYLHEAVPNKKQLKFKLYMDKYAYSSNTMIYEYQPAATLINDIGTIL
jgi:hypothetical protein